MMMIKNKIPEKWAIQGLKRHSSGNGFLLSEQVYCVQSGCHSVGYIENVARLITTCFNVSGEYEKETDMIDTGGLTWDFIVSVHRGGNVEDVVAACIMVHGHCEPDDGRQLMYVFDVCTHPCMAKRGIAKVLMNSVYFLCSAMVADGQLQCDNNNKLWLVLDVDLNSTIVVTPDKLISIYSSCGFVASPGKFTGIKPVEHCHPRWKWHITGNPETRCQLWREVGPRNTASSSSSCVLSKSVISELNPIGALTSIIMRFETLLDHHHSFSTETPQLSHSNNSFCAVLPIHLRSSKV